MERIIVAIIALFVGSAFNIWVDCYLIREQKRSGRYNQCPKCFHPYTFWDYIPILPALIHFGKCRFCGQKKDLRYVFCPIICVFIVLVCYDKWQGLEALSFILFLWIVWLLAQIDLYVYQVPSRLLGVLMLTTIPIVYYHQEIVLLDRIVALFLISAPLFLLSRIKKNSIGSGDILYTMIAGFALGIWGIIASTAIAYVMAGIYAIFSLCLRRKKWQSPIPMFPFFLYGTLVFIHYLLHFITITLR